MQLILKVKKHSFLVFIKEQQQKFKGYTLECTSHTLNPSSVKQVVLNAVAHWRDHIIYLH